MTSAKTYSLVFLLSFMATMEAQNYALQTNPKTTKYHQTFFDFDKKIEFKEINTTKPRYVNKDFSKTEILKYKHDILKLEQYQEKLIALGYDVKSAGTLATTYTNFLTSVPRIVLTRYTSA